MTNSTANAEQIKTATIMAVTGYTVWNIASDFDDYLAMAEQPEYAAEFEGYENNIESDKRVAAKLNIKRCMKVENPLTGETKLAYIHGYGGNDIICTVELGGCLSSSTTYTMIMDDALACYVKGCDNTPENKKTIAAKGWIVGSI